MFEPAEPGIYYHGTRADLKIGDQLTPGYASNFGRRNTASWIYFAATLEAAIWGAELAEGEGRQRIYIVKPTGEFVDDPNLTDKKYPGNPSKSYRSQRPLKIVGEVDNWTGHAPDKLAAMKESVDRARRMGIEAID